jgi:ubiquinone/menaquinone biosynthesis C-methylase UbiE
VYEELYGIDIAPVRIAAARKALADLGDRRIDLRVVNIDREGLPFEKGYFDAVVMMGVLSLVFDVEMAIREVHRVLKPGGVFLLETNNLAQLSHRLRLLVGKQPRINPDFHGWDGNALHYFVLKPLVDMLSSEGLRVRRVCSAGRLSRFRSWSPSLLAEHPMILASKE